MRIGRVILIGFVLLVLANLWVRQDALITLAAQVAMAVPPVPALAAWLVFFVALYGLFMCIALVFRPVWEQDEHLTYPMAELPVMLAGYRREVLHCLERDIIIAFAGSERLAPSGDFRSLTLLTLQHFLSRGYIPQLAAFPQESFKIAREIRVDVRKMIMLMVAAVVLGSVVSWWTHIASAYVFGADVLEGGTTSGGHRVALTVNACDILGGRMRGPQAPHRPRAVAALAGVAIVISLAALRRLFIQFPPPAPYGVPLRAHRCGRVRVGRPADLHHYQADCPTHRRHEAV